MIPSTADVLRALADLAPAAPTRSWSVAQGGRPVVWLPDAHGTVRGAAANNLAALDALHREERLLRRAWGMVSGTLDRDGTPRKVLLPVLSQPVRLERQLGSYKIVAAGDLELTPLIEDRTLAAQLEAAPGLAAPGWLRAPGTVAWLRTAAEAAGLPVTGVVDEVPERGTDLVLIRQGALYVVRDVNGRAMRDALLSWAGREGLEGTALATVYAGSPPAPVERGEVLSPLPLNEAQADVVRAARAAPVVVVSGPPGSGKSHAVVAAALDTVDRGGSVLVATQSQYAAEVLGELLRRYHGPEPVLFGDSEQRRSMVEGPGLRDAVDERTIAAQVADVRAAQARVAQLLAGIHRALDTERYAAGLPGWEPLIPALAAELPSLFEDADLDAATELAGALDSVPTGWWAGWRHRRRVARLRRTTRVPETVTTDRLRAAIEAARAQRSVARLAATGGTNLAATWAALVEADAALARAVGTLMRSRSRSPRRWHGEARRMVSVLSTALRAGRARRREILAGANGPALLDALPLWIGTVADVEDLLPPSPGLFDLVILDEASHIDQVRAAPVLARARRALVAGDPRQLRFVSFVADVDVADTLRRYGLDDRLDVRRSSAFDLAAGAAPVVWLDEHYRCVPHLIEFSARRFYDGRLTIATRHPRNEQTDVIDVVPVAGATVSDGVNAAEVDAVLRVVASLAESGVTRIGVVTPFRPQADALEAALVGAYPVEEIERLGLRVGTVHAFQGSEADVVVASLGVVDADSAGRVRFLADPTLFNVLITRARQRMVVVTSLSGLSGGTGIVADYLAYSTAGPAPVTGGAAGDWAAALAASLVDAGVAAVRPAYPSGRWTVDLSVGTGAAARGLVCAVHPDGVDAHVRRQRALLRAGWTLVDAFPSRWSGNASLATVDLAT